MSWQEEIDELARRRALAEKMGGEDKVARQHARGKMDARARIDALLDPGSFREIGKIAGRGSYDENGDLVDLSPSNFIFGRGDIDGRAIVASADDFTVRGGAADAALHRKFVQCEAMAHELRLPLVRMIDGTGGGGSVKSLETMGYTYVPMVRLGAYRHQSGHRSRCGARAWPDGGARRGAHGGEPLFGDGQGPVAAVCRRPGGAAAIGETVDKEQLGGTEIHCRNGVIDEEVASEAEAFAVARRFLSYLPSSIDRLAARTPCTDPVDRREEVLLSAVPRDPGQVYAMRRVLAQVFDHGSVFEMGRRWGRAVITAFARWTAGRSRCWRAIPAIWAVRGRPGPARRPSGS